MELRQLTEKTHKRFYTESGREEIPKREIRLTNTGSKVLKDTGIKINIYDRIQECKNECDVIEITRRAMVGDQVALQKLQKVGNSYGDMTVMPTSLLEAKQIIIDAEKSFEQLPLEIRKEFNNNVDEFLAGTKNGKIKEVVEKHLPKKEEKAEELTKKEDKEQVL